MSRLIGSALGLLAFSTAIVAGLWARNPFGVILSRALWAMVIFCLIGLSLGWAVQLVVREHMRRREALSASSEENADSLPVKADDGNRSSNAEVEPMGN